MLGKCPYACRFYSHPINQSAVRHPPARPPTGCPLPLTPRRDAEARLQAALADRAQTAPLLEETRWQMRQLEKKIEELREAKAAVTSERDALKQRASGAAEELSSREQQMEDKIVKLKVRRGWHGFTAAASVRGRRFHPLWQAGELQRTGCAACFNAYMMTLTRNLLFFLLHPLPLFQ